MILLVWELRRRPRLPIEVCENILDHIVPERGPVEVTTDTTAWETLVSCMKVCKDWYPCARKNLWRHVVEGQSNVSSIYKDHEYLLPHLNELDVGLNPSYSPTSSFFITRQAANLHTLSLMRPNMPKEHVLFYRSPIFRTVRTLFLVLEHELQASQLARLINAFPSLSSLTLMLVGVELGHKGQVLPPARKPIPSLSYLYLTLLPGVFRLIDWLAKAGLLASLKTLFLSSDTNNSVAEFRSHFEGVDRLINNCGSSVEDLTLSFYRFPISDDVETPGISIFSLPMNLVTF